MKTSPTLILIVLGILGALLALVNGPSSKGELRTAAETMAAERAEAFNQLASHP